MTKYRFYRGDSDLRLVNDAHANLHIGSSTHGSLPLSAHSSVASAYDYLGPMPHPRRRRPVSFHPRRVLVVEDDDSFAEALTELLEADGRLEVAGRARDGREAIELAEALRPDVVLMDIVLPVMDGVEATREIRRRQPTIPVVGITGSEYEERALEVQEAGAVDFVRKGRLDPDLVEIVVAAAHHRRRRRRGRQTSG
jgi:CheY-like chemotaxis protein